MKKLFLLLSTVLLVLSAAAQESDPAERNLKLMVRNRKGKVMQDLDFRVQIKGADHRAESLDRFGNRFFRVTDSDTLILFTGVGDIYELPTAGLDSVYLVFKNRHRLAGMARHGENGPEMVDIGYGSISRQQNTSSVSQLNMDGANGYSDLRSYIQGRVAGVNFMGDQLIIRGVNSINSGIEALILVDGVAMQNFSTVNSMISPRDVASISVLKDAGSTGIYGVRGANGVVLITTKKGGDK